MGPPAPLVGLLGFVLLATAAVGFCPVYRLLGMNTWGRPPR
ncbi:YgaP family membrane protein [Novilysobacter arseniciresistens]